MFQVQCKVLYTYLCADQHALIAIRNYLIHTGSYGPLTVRSGPSRLLFRNIVNFHTNHIVQTHEGGPSYISKKKRMARL